jgi:hypothetical protein
MAASAATFLRWSADIAQVLILQGLVTAMIPAAEGRNDEARLRGPRLRSAKGRWVPCGFRRPSAASKNYFFLAAAFFFATFFFAAFFLAAMMKLLTG